MLLTTAAVPPRAKEGDDLGLHLLRHRSIGGLSVELLAQLEGTAGLKTEP